MADLEKEENRRTRIPKLKFREAMNKVKRERRESAEREEVPPYQRRSSIPRLKKQSSIEVPPTAEDEFDKIYDEIIDSPVDIDNSILNSKVEDLSLIENTFEEIIHAYDENEATTAVDTNKPAVNNKTKTKIPMLKRKSDPEIEIPKPHPNDVKTKPRSNFRDVVKFYNKENKEEAKYKRKLPARSGIPRRNSNDESNLSENKKRDTASKIKNDKDTDDKVNNRKLLIKQQSLDSEYIRTPKLIKQAHKIEAIEDKVPIYHETVELLPTEEITEIENNETQNDIQIKPIKVVTIEEMKIIEEKIKSQYSRDNISQIVPSVEENLKEKNSISDNNNEPLVQVEEKIVFNGNVARDAANESSEDDIPIIKGKVSRIIQRLGSREKEESAKNVTNEIPKTKSVLSKIALFERQEQVEIKSNKYEPPSSRRVNDFEQQNSTPKIVSSVLKSYPALRNSIDSKTNIIDTDLNDNLMNTENLTAEVVDINNIYETEEILIDDQDLISDNDEIDELNQDNFNEDVDNVAKHEIESEISELAVEFDYVQPINETPIDLTPKYNQINIINNEGVLFNNKSNISHHYVPEIQRVRTIDVKNNEIYKEIHIDDEDSNKNDDESEISKLTDSNAVSDIGDYVKGKVHAMIVRMNSTETLEVEKRDVISIKERIRKNSVSEKIALFEGKLTTVPINLSPRLTTTGSKATPGYADDELELLDEKIEELKEAKVKYGGVAEVDGILLNNGVEMPVIALGTARMGPQLTFHVVSTAIDMGYRSIDTSMVYGNEREIGEAIRMKIEDGTVKREDLFIISKLWSTFHRADLVEEACRRSLEAMSLQYFDLYLINFPVSYKEGGDFVPKIANVLQYSDNDYLTAWFGMEDLVRKGLVRSIGVSNFNSQQLQKIIDRSRIKPVVNQVESHPYLNQAKLDDFCNARNVRLLCYGVLGGKGEWKDLGVDGNTILEDPLLQVMAAGLGLKASQLLIKFHLDQGRAVVAKSSKGEHLHENLEAASIVLEDSYVDALMALNKNKRTYTFKGLGDTHRNYPFRIPF